MKKYFVAMFMGCLLSSAMATPTTTNTSSNSPDSPFRVVGDLIFLSGVPGGDVSNPNPESEVKEALDNLKTAAEQAGGSLNDIIKVTVYMVDPINDYTVLNMLTPDYFQAPYPARSPVGVSALPGGKRIEIDAIMKNPASNA